MIAKLSLRLQKEALVVDIDGTLAIDTRRSHLRPTRGSKHCLNGASRDEIERYMAPELVQLDGSILGAELFVTMLRPSHVIIATARWEPLRAVTAAWLARWYGFPPSTPLLMRRAGDITSASVDVKLGAVVAYCAAEGVRIGAWLDDDTDMLTAAVDAFGCSALRAPDVYRRRA